MTQPLGHQGTTEEYRWPVVATDEPPGARVPVGYVTVLKRVAAEEDEPEYSIFFADANGLPLQGLTYDQFWIYFGAAAKAFTAIGLQIPLDSFYRGEIIAAAPPTPDVSPPG